METTLLQQSNDWRERRRLRAWELFEQGWKQKDIAAKLDATEGAVSQWLKRAKTEGRDGLRKRCSPGRPCRLSWEQKARIPHLLLRGAQAWGVVGDVWTCERIAQVIVCEYDVTYHPDTVGDLLKSCGWSYQKPVCRATQRKEDAIREWKQERLPALKKGRTQAGINSCL